MTMKPTSTDILIRTTMFSSRAIDRAPSRLTNMKMRIIAPANASTSQDGAPSGIRAKA
jgi:hypothetical protein